MNEPKYLLDGSAVEVLETLGSGKLLVALLYESYAGEEGELQADSGHPFVVDRVFDSAPTQVMDSRIEEAQQRLDALEAQRVEVTNKLRAAQVGEREIEAKLKRHAQLSRLMDFIDRKITHYVESTGWAPPVIRKFEDCVCGADRMELKLLTLFGSTKGDLAWRLNYYKDGSGLSCEVWPCCSLDEAKAKMAEIFTAWFAKGPRRDILEAADLNGVPVPSGYREELVAVERKGLAAQEEKLRAEIIGIRDKLAALK